MAKTICTADSAARLDPNLPMTMPPRSLQRDMTARSYAQILTQG
jgi:hypothetical protein